MFIVVKLKTIIIIDIYIIHILYHIFQNIIRFLNVVNKLTLSGRRVQYNVYIGTIFIVIYYIFQVDIIVLNFN